MAPRNRARVGLGAGVSRRNATRRATMLGQAERPVCLPLRRADCIGQHRKRRVVYLAFPTRAIHQIEVANIEHFPTDIESRWRQILWIELILSIGVEVPILPPQIPRQPLFPSDLNCFHSTKAFDFAAFIPD